MEPTDPPANGQKPRRFVSILPILRLVHPKPPEKSDKRPRTRSGKRRPYQCDVFTTEELRILRVSLHTARGLFGTWACLADAMRVPLNALKEGASGRNRVSAALAVRLSRALGVPFEALFRPGLRVVKNPCQTCGAAQGKP